MDMLTGIATLEEKYIELCKKHGTVPNTSILSAFFEAEDKKSRNQRCVMSLLIDRVMYDDFHPLLELCNEINSSEVEGIDLSVRSSCSLEDQYVLSLIRSVNQKLGRVDVHDCFGTSFWRDVFSQGLSCQILNVRSLHFRKLNIVGEFAQLHTLVLDSNRVTGFGEGCFSCMPNLTCLSMCDTVVSDLWTASSALLKLPSLEDLRFQDWICCSESSSSTPLKPQSSDENMFDESKNSSTEADFSGVFQQMDPEEDDLDSLYAEVFMGEKVRKGKMLDQTNDVGLKYISTRASPICSKKHYRIYMINSLPKLKVLDNLAIRKSDRDRATETYSENFEHLPYMRKNKESVVRVLEKRETRSSRWKSRSSYTRSLCAARMGSSAWPLLHSIPFGRFQDESRSLSPRQFEYHPLDPSLMVYGTLDGEVVVLNHESGKILRYIPSHGAQSSILGLCWLKTYPSMVIAGSANGSLKLYDIQKASSTLNTTTHTTSGSVTFDEFDQLTSVHVNSTDKLFLASGYSKDVALYDIGSGTRLQVFANMHQEHINVVKFSNHSPSVFATSSFDKDVKLWDLRQEPSQPCYTASSTKGNVMVCFSPDDRYLLTSAVDNEVRQLLTVDGRLHLNFDIVPTGSSMNYTRSYYMNGNDYIISGSCDESMVRVCCAQTGRRLRDVSLEGNGSEFSMMFVQSLRGDPFREFNMSVLATYTRPSSVSEIVKVNLLAPRDHIEEQSCGVHCYPSSSMGG
ncbi:transducin family protein / WD-40 repeat family protein [Raphanus sativus]|uniref:Protein DWD HYPERSENSITIVE TO UV-B 1 isoform X2 n=1 Tax=Raphanus sativus TaxID=3726 RepID=A0A6J0KDY0_RAPSA|nr:protein DWD HYPERSENSITIVE TO UV-B 1 isoform X2 [Raphanus sativus]KAJ4914270.1 transducin family protein / WD-40 repeat family protein [Raphanus sativus]